MLSIILFKVDNSIITHINYYFKMKIHLLISLFFTPYTVNLYWGDIFESRLYFTWKKNRKKAQGIGFDASRGQ